MTTLMNNLNKKLFQELSDETAATCSGGGKFYFGDLVCKDTQDGFWGKDELSLKINGKTVWQTGGVSPGEKFNLRALGTFNYNSKTKVELIERDPGPDDLIGYFKPSWAKSPVELNQADALYYLGFRRLS